jgi:hypothetical protein
MDDLALLRPLVARKAILEGFEEKGDFFNNHLMAFLILKYYIDINIGVSYRSL